MLIIYIFYNRVITIILYTSVRLSERLEIFTYLTLLISQRKESQIRSI